MKFSLACMVWKFGMYNCVIAVSWLWYSWISDSNLVLDFMRAFLS